MIKWLDENAEFKHLPVTLLVENPVQPPPRSTDSAVSTLAESMLESKLCSPLIVTRIGKTGKFMIIDGHRRHVASIKHNRDTLPCLIVDHPDPEILFVILGKGVRGVSGVDWLSVWSRTSDERRNDLLNAIPESGRKNIESMIEIFGRTRVIQLGKDGLLSPHMAKWILIAEKYVNRTGAAIPLRQIGEWVVKHRASNVINQMYRQKSPISLNTSKRLRAYVVHDQPYQDHGRLPTGKKERNLRVV